MPLLIPLVFVGGGIVGFQLSEGSSKLIMLLTLLVVGYVLLKGKL
ncbi:hypothetical protein VISI1226_20600 [Vibrio sinaloensis DSM 21326]|uniref:Uncharacterized protein n=1 Tax=Vibrio sinaloensis DSM 21326 TaxID=945550 RepID=E8M0Z4_PHOS4|nr:hypothetical protein [Vibrio sinaloensis]EGA72380.1 hypothetical protein VISI1226_20600 [Vibrio sinaloensis DSM 21326]